MLVCLFFVHRNASQRRKEIEPVRPVDATFNKQKEQKHIFFKFSNGKGRRVSPFWFINFYFCFS